MPFITFPTKLKINSDLTLTSHPTCLRTRSTSLPQQLPGRHDNDIAEVEASLRDRILDATEIMRDLDLNSTECELNRKARVNAGKAVMIIPEEAEYPILILRNPDRLFTYLHYSLGINFSKEMLHFDTFRFYTIPNLQTGSPPTVQNRSWHSGRQTLSQSLGTMAIFLGTTQREKVPAKFLEEWFGLTRKGQDFSSTPLGFIAKVEIWVGTIRSAHQAPPYDPTPMTKRRFYLFKSQTVSMIETQTKLVILVTSVILIMR
ncbi:uncharacterized protein BO80DRAFT_479633 [Aspergillus ibericus CBS 121593]|uniref:Uncharacterized protein n=1 Tax=Aspergillus ibericus CBS 121593 TaxID=1448316 RepID=A0A395GU25_9EURO|nr:hypothetical protein BO80DRAFT_479633 [Aspergillus ibericus CBS 121593]RAK98458.1 hypothetical protein BO80DRAFT_479633 [Aspergillus ibericus CBS 121593]